MPSPTPNKKEKEPVLLTFPQALNAVIEEKMITRIDWDNKEIYGGLKDGFLKIKIDGEWHEWMVSDGDLIAIDWIVLEGVTNA